MWIATSLVKIYECALRVMHARLKTCGECEAKLKAQENDVRKWKGKEGIRKLTQS
jgi:hypothetical protein